MRLLPCGFAVVLCLLAPASVWAADSDVDGLEDEWELSYFVNLEQEDGTGDPDGDLLTNLDEQAAGTDPTREDTDGDGLSDKAEVDSPFALDPTQMDTDGDFLMDGEEIGLGTNPTEPDSDFDGLTDYIEVVKGYQPLNGDSDDGGVWDGEEVLVDKTDPLDASDDLMDSDNDGLTNYIEAQLGTNPFAADTDGDWLGDGEEDANQDGVWDPEAGETDPSNPDSDGDGLPDGWETLVYKTDPFVPDTDGDGLSDGEEHQLRMTQFECLNPLKADSDKDGVTDGVEAAEGAISDPCIPDTDGDGVLDVSEVFDGTDPADGDDAALDTDGDGLSDGYESAVSNTAIDDPDTDGDGLDDADDHLPLVDGFVTDPLDADTDDDGILDGNEGGIDSEDGLAGGTSPVAADSDKDKLLDGLELGLSAPEVSAKDPDATDMSVFQADTDPETTTGAVDADSDEDGLNDGTEDANLNGQVDADETDPNIFDTDGDGMDDKWEWTYSTDEACGGAPLGPLDPLDPGDKNLDNDKDGLTNFQEYQNTWWVGNQEIKNDTDPCDIDSDDDGLNDKTEVYGKYNQANPFNKGTNPNEWDTDKDGLSDGAEDKDKNGKWQPFLETNPTQKDTDGDNLDDGYEINVVGTEPNNGDTDGDGLNDGLEHNLFGTDPLDSDTDDDLLPDGLETGVMGKDDCPGTKSNPHLPDTDGDGLSDGTEDADHDGCWELQDGETNPLDPDTDGDKLSDGLEVGAGGDADPETTTDPLNKDSDEDGLWDSHEDKSKDGAVDDDETDPNKKDTDEGGVADGTEVLVDGTDPLNPLDDLTADPDGDGLTNGEEKAIGTNPYDADTDGDTISDTVEVGENHLDPPDSDDDGTIDAKDTDSDADTIPDSVEAGDADLETPPVNTDGDEFPDYLDKDSDGDEIADQIEWNVDADNDGDADIDADSDGTPNYLDTDSDNVQEGDLEEGVGDEDGDGIPNFVDPKDDPPEDVDVDGDGLKNTEELEVTGTDPHNPDTDGDGLTDKEEWEGPTDPLDADCDDDGLPDGDDGLEDTDGDGLIHAFDPDSDDDGVFDGTERGIEKPIPDQEYESENGQTYAIFGTDLTQKNFRADVDPSTTTDHTAADSDGDGADDGAEDHNHNGQVDIGEMDPTDGMNLDVSPDEVLEILADDDQDGLTNRQEWGQGIVAMDGDLDDDGILDGAEHNWRNDTDLDGLPNFRDPDSDDDFLSDGQEQGMTEFGDDTEIRYFNVALDTDEETTTFALLADSDGDGLLDGEEDANANGAVDDDESDPRDADDAVVPLDDDEDGLPDVREVLLGSSLDKQDTDDDGLLDGEEFNAPFDIDHDGLAAVIDPDADNDGLADGIEVGAAGDTDPTTTTCATVWDTDDSGLSDGSEDTNKNGAVDAGEGDPLDPMDDGDFCVDTDTDGLCNAEEEWFGLDPLDLDSDDDGLFDGDEHNWNFDTDNDGLASAFDPDSDGDEINDGTEMGVTSAVGDGQAELDGEVVVLLGTDLQAGFFVADADPETTTFMLVADSDRGGLADGVEDDNKNGRLDEFETDPNDPRDDLPVDGDADGDGLLNGLEQQIGTDPHNADSDGDTIPDPVEVGDDPENPVDTDDDGTIDALDADSDNDTIPDKDEAGDDDLDTPPVDTDGDEMPDYVDTDSDGDLLSDEEEVTWYLTDPRDTDTDDGGVGDYLEVTQHFSDPNDPSDDYRGWFEDGAEIRGGSCRTGGTSGGWLAIALLLVALLALRGRRRLVSWVSAMLVVLMALPALAQYQPDPVYHPDALKTGMAANFYRLTPDGNGIFSVHHGSALQHLEFHGSLVMHYAYAPLVVGVDKDISRELVSHRFESHVQAGIGLLGFLNLGVQAPFVLYQQGQLPGMGLGDIDAMGTGNMAFFAKGQVLSPERFPIGIALALPVYLPALGGDYSGFDGFGLAPTLALSSHVSDFWVSLNLGYLMQPEEHILATVDDDKLTAGLGVSYAVTEALEAGFEVVGATRAGDPFGDGNELQAELDAGIKYRIGPIRIIAGAGKGLTHGFATPNARAFIGAEYVWKPNPDRDGDGILNLDDKCPDIPEDADNFEDGDGCPDEDNDKDRVLDKDDGCPNDPEDFDGFQDEDGCPDPDNDGDGVPDKQDKCPSQPEDLDGFEDEDGCPDPDNDGDGFPDVKDKCPNKPETLNDYQDEDGCPDKKLAEFQEEARRIQILDKVHFKFMSAEIQEASYELLDQVAQILKDNPQVLFVQIEGHTDRTGDRKFNMTLSIQRSEAVRDYLIGKGVSGDRLRAKGYGDKRPVDYRNGPEANFNNRRVEFNILKYAE